MSTTTMKTRVTSFAPQFLVDDLERSIAYYEKVGFSFAEPWDGFYAIGVLDGLEVHLKEAPKNQAERQWRRDNEHLDASAGVDGIEAFYEQCVANGVTILKPLAATAWGTKDFYIEDPDGYIVSFGIGRCFYRMPTARKSHPRSCVGICFRGHIRSAGSSRASSPRSATRLTSGKRWRPIFGSSI